MDYLRLVAPRTRRLTANAIREILKVASQPGMISLAGGVPSPASFPLELMEVMHAAVLREHGAQALQYGITEGFPPLQAALAERLQSGGIEASAEELLIMNGSQAVLDAVGKALIAPGDTVAVESPTYLGALQAFAPYGPHFEALPCDAQGLRPDGLETVLQRRAVKMVYLVPTFQNPTGRTLPQERRRAVAALLEKYGTLLVEDDPYADLRYEGTRLPPIKSLAPSHVIYVGTLSKIFAPGLRLGYCLAPPALRPWLVRIKQGVDLHTSTYTQAIAAEYLGRGHLQRHLPQICALYRPRLQALLNALERYFPPGFQWSRPEGGMFVWVEGPSDVDMQACYPRAVRRGVAYVPGHHFFTRKNQGRAAMRLNFTMADPADLDRAVAILAEVLAPPQAACA